MPCPLRRSSSDNFIFNTSMWSVPICQGGDKVQGFSNEQVTAPDLKEITVNRGYCKPNM